MFAFCSGRDLGRDFLSLSLFPSMRTGDGRQSRSKPASQHIVVLAPSTTRALGADARAIARAVRLAGAFGGGASRSARGRAGANEKRTLVLTRFINSYRV